MQLTWKIYYISTLFFVNVSLKNNHGWLSFIDKRWLKVKDINGNIKYRKATLIDVAKSPKVGALVTETFDIDSNKKIKFNIIIT